MHFSMECVHIWHNGSLLYVVGVADMTLDSKANVTYTYILALKWYHLLITFGPYFISILSRSKTSPNERTMSSLHGDIKRLFKGFAFLKENPIPVYLCTRYMYINYN